MVSRTKDGAPAAQSRESFELEIGCCVLREIGLGPALGWGSRPGSGPRVRSPLPLSAFLLGKLSTRPHPRGCSSLHAVCLAFPPPSAHSGPLLTKRAHATAFAWSKLDRAHALSGRGPDSRPCVRSALVHRRTPRRSGASSDLGGQAQLSTPAPPCCRCPGLRRMVSAGSLFLAVNAHVCPRFFFYFLPPPSFLLVPPGLVHSSRPFSYLRTSTLPQDGEHARTTQVRAQATRPTK